MPPERRGPARPSTRRPARGAPRPAFDDGLSVTRGPLPPRPELAPSGSWWGEAWREALERSSLDAARLARGRVYARDGHVGAVTVTPGRISAPVHGSRAQPYRAAVRLPTLTDDAWETLLDAVAGRPAQLDALLVERRLPPALASAEVRLLPAADELAPSCSCPDRGHPCKHAAALCFETARLLDADPYLLLLVRGRSERAVLDGLQRRNAALSAEASEGTATPAHDPGVLAHQALAANRVLPSPPPPRPLPERPGQPPALPDPGPLPLDLRVLELLAADATRRAHAYLAAPPATNPPPVATARPPHAARPTAATPQVDSAARLFGAGLAPYRDVVRLAAAALPTSGLTSGTRALHGELAAATGHAPAALARAVAAWRQGEEEGLALLEADWDPPAGDFDRARGVLLAAGLPALRPHRNRLTDTRRGVQLRFGHDRRWYPYEAVPGGEDWWPAGPPSRDPVTALRRLLS